MPTAEWEALDPTVPVDETTRRTQTLVHSHTQPIPLLYDDAMPFVSLGSLAWHANARVLTNLPKRFNWDAV
jgi:hypothetical protein